MLRLGVAVVCAVLFHVGCVSTGPPAIEAKAVPLTSSFDGYYYGVIDGSVTVEGVTKAAICDFEWTLVLLEDQLQFNDVYMGCSDGLESWGIESDAIVHEVQDGTIDHGAGWITDNEIFIHTLYGDSFIDERLRIVLATDGLDVEYYYAVYDFLETAQGFLERI